MALQVSKHDGETAQPASIALYYDFSSPESYLALERLAKSIAAYSPELTPVRAVDLDPLPTPDDDARRTLIEELASRSDVLPLVWPPTFPNLDTRAAVRVATYAKSIGKVAVFSLSLFRQIYAAGNDPAAVTTLYLAAAASEIHPRAVDQALSRDKVKQTADEATAAARGLGVSCVPTLRVNERLITGPALQENVDQVMRDALRGTGSA